jgi:ankyrin repeat protein
MATAGAKRARSDESEDDVVEVYDVGKFRSFTHRRRIIALFASIRDSSFDDLFSVLFCHGDATAARTDGDKSLLHVAAEIGDVAVLQLLLQSGADPEAVMMRGDTPLHLAVRGRHAACVRPLVSFAMHGVAFLDARGDAGQTALHVACEHGSEDIATTLLELGASTEIGDAKGATPLHAAAKAGREPCVRLLLARGASASAVCSRGKNALHYAAAHGSLPLLEPFLGAAADVINARDGAGDTPLLIALRRGRSAACAMALLDRHATFHDGGLGGSTPLHLACASNMADVAQRLLDLDAPLNARDDLGNTPLHASVLHGSLACLHLLVRNGAIMDARNLEGRTPLGLLLRHETPGVLAMNHALVALPEPEPVVAAAPPGGVRPRECAICAAPASSWGAFVPCGHTVCTPCLRGFRDRIQAGGLRAECPHCRADVRDFLLKVYIE